MRRFTNKIVVIMRTFRSAIAMSALPPKADMDASSALAQLARLLGRLAARQSQSQRAANEMSHAHPLKSVKKRRNRKP